MTEQEAIRVLETQPLYECIEVCVPNALQCDACENRVALDMAIEALEKQMQYEFLIGRACAELNYYQAKLYEAEKVLFKEGHVEYAIPYSIKARTPDEWREYLEE